MQKYRRTGRDGHIGMSAEDKAKRRSSIGGSDAKIIMGGDEKAIQHLWSVKRGEAEDDDLSDVVLVQLGNITEDFNLDLFEVNTGLYVTDDQEKAHHPDYSFLHATLDGRVRETLDGPCLGIMDAKFMLPFSRVEGEKWTIETALAKHYAQLQHNMMVTQTSRAWLSVIKATGGYEVIDCEADEFYQVALLDAEIEFWEAVKNGTMPGTASAEVDIPASEKIVEYDFTGKNEWAAAAANMIENMRSALIYDASKDALKDLVPKDAGLVHGHGIKIKRAKNNRLLFEVDGEKDVKSEVKRLLAGDESEPPKKVTKPRAKKVVAEAA